MEITATEALRPHHEIHLEHYLISFLSNVFFFFKFLCLLDFVLRRDKQGGL